MSTTPRLKSYLTLHCAVLLWGSLGVFSVLLPFPVPVFVFLREAIAAATLLLFLGLKRRLHELCFRTSHVLMVSVAGSFIALSNISFF